MQKLLAFIVVGGCLASLPILAPMISQPALPSLAARIMIYAIAAASLNLALGNGGMVSFGHAAFYGLGGYVVGILYLHKADDSSLLGFIPGSDQLLVTLPIAVMLSGVAAFLIGGLALRTGGVQFIMITLAFAQMLFSFFVSLNGYGGEDGIIVRNSNYLLGISLRDKTAAFYVVLVLTLAFFAVLYRITGSSFGTILGGIRQNETRMSSIGINSYRYKLVAFVLSGMGAGLAGALMTVLLRFTSPEALSWTKSGEFMIMVILGGVGAILGPVWGAAAFLLLQTYLSSWTEHWQLFMGAILLFVVLFTRDGLAGAFSSLRRRFL